MNAPNIRFQERIDRASVLSLDVFDTSLFRKLARPVDVFRAMEDDVQATIGSNSIHFSVIRTQAEREALSHLRSTPGNGQVTLELIYKTLQAQTSWPAEIAQRVMELEIATELRFLYANQGV